MRVSFAGVAKLADAQDLGSCGVTLGGSSPLSGTKNRLFTSFELVFHFLID